MKTEKLSIENIPALLLGEKSDKIFLFIHGQNGNKEEAIRFAALAVPAGWQVLCIDLPEHGERKDGQALLPWVVLPELHTVMEYLKSNWAKIAIRANSIGAWFCMLGFADEKIDMCLFVSPILDMEKLIENMMRWAGVSEERLRQEKEIQTDFKQTLSFDYLTFVREYPIKEWNIPTKILYGENDQMTTQETVSAFVHRFHCDLCVMKNGEHWFHTEEQIRFMNHWEEINI